MNSNQKTFLKHFENYLAHTLDPIVESNLKEAMMYALSAQGKRFRPLLIYSVANRAVDDAEVLLLASAIEMIHTYSLVHDDLPAMDNDDLRRGQATVHKKFDEATAILVGDALLTYAFELIAKSTLNSDKKVDALRILASASGANGMIYGQVLDMQETHGTSVIDELTLCYENKTGALFSAALQLGDLLNEKGMDSTQLERIGKWMGIVFQIQDDYLEASTDTTVLGKSNRSDIDNNKQTYVKYKGLEETHKTIIQLYENLNRAIIELPISTKNLSDLVDIMRQRHH